MVHIQEIVNSLFTSKTYIIHRDGNENAWLVDIGDIEPVVSYLSEKNLRPEGVFLTHGHFDHLYGINNFIEKYPNCKVYATPFCIECLASPKLNMSKYHESPVSYDGDNVIALHEGKEICLFDTEPAMHVYETPGHNPGCMTMVFGNMIFTGDSFIPQIKVVTNVPGGDKIKAQESLERILQLSINKTIYPGHGEVFKFGEIREYYEKYIKL